MPPRLLGRLAIEREGDIYTGLQGLSLSGRVPDLEEERKSRAKSRLREMPPHESRVARVP
jgi:hypothetical protein